MTKFYDLVRMTTSTTGTGTITLGTAVPGFLALATAGAADGDQITYTLQDGVSTELGHGTYSASAGTLTRTVLKSTNGNNPINLSGLAQVVCSLASEDLKLANLLDVETAGATDGQALIWNAASGRFTVAAAVTTSTATTPSIVQHKYSTSQSLTFDTTPTIGNLVILLTDGATSISDSTMTYVGKQVNGDMGLSIFTRRVTAANQTTTINASGITHVVGIEVANAGSIEFSTATGGWTSESDGTHWTGSIPAIAENALLMVFLNAYPSAATYGAMTTGYTQLSLFDQAGIVVAGPAVTPPATPPPFDILVEGSEVWFGMLPFYIVGEPPHASLTQLNDVVGVPSDGDVLLYDATKGSWTPVNLLTYISSGGTTRTA
jgi:hypothetical protein